MNWAQIGRFLRTLFLLRVPLFTLVMLAAFPLVAFITAKTLLGNLFDVQVVTADSTGVLSVSNQWTGWYLFIVSFSAFLCAFAAVTVINLIVHYGRDRFDDPALNLEQKRPLLTFFSGIAAALPIVVTTALHSGGTAADKNSQLPGWILWLMPTLGFLCAFVLVFLAKVIQLLFTDPKTTRHPPPYLIFPVYKIAPLERFFDALYCRQGKQVGLVKRGVHLVSQWPLEILRCAGQGYLIDCDAPPGSLTLRSGHVFALALSIIAFATYLGIGYFKGKINESPARVPALAFLLLFGIVLCWALGAITFFLDRYRVPLFSGLAIVSLITLSAPQSDHVYRVERRGTPDRIEPAALVHKRAAAGTRRLILVATAGGGIQAAAWTAQVLRGLEEECSKASDGHSSDSQCDFRSSVVLISGVSGGSLGAIAYARSFTDFPSQVRPEEVPINAAQSALDEVAWAWINPDVARAVLPWFRTQHIDRGWALEEKWAAVNKTYVSRATKLERLITGDYGADTWLGTWAKQTQDNAMPALLLNATLAEQGRPLVFSSTDFPHANDPRGLLNFHILYPDFDIRVTTAARLSASFPYVAPAARANLKPPPAGDNHVVDGGYYDNYGITSLLGWLEDVIENETDADLAVDLKDVLILQIRPFAQSSPNSPAPKGWGFQLVAPINALLNVRDTGQSARDRTELALFTESRKDKIRIWREDFFYPATFTKQDQNCANTPLSWKLSFEQRKCITTAWHTLHDSNKGKGRISCVVGYLQNQPISKRQAWTLSGKDETFCTAGDDNQSGDDNQ